MQQLDEESRRQNYYDKSGRCKLFNTNKIKILNEKKSVSLSPLCKVEQGEQKWELISDGTNLKLIDGVLIPKSCMYTNRMRFIKYLASCAEFICRCWISYTEVNLDCEALGLEIPANLSFEQIKSAKVPEPLGLDLCIDDDGKTYWRKTDRLEFPCVLKHKHNDRLTIFQQKGDRYKAWYLDGTTFTPKVADKPTDQDLFKEWSGVMRCISPTSSRRYTCLFFQKPEIKEKFALAVVIHDLENAQIGFIKSTKLTDFPVTLRFGQDWFLLDRSEAGLYKFTSLLR